MSTVISLSISQVSIVDFNKEVGKQLTAELAAKYGSSHVSFIHCDVTKSSEFEGKLIRRQRDFTVG